MAIQLSPFEESLSDALGEWVLKAHGIVSSQQNPGLFMQILRNKCLEVVKLGDVTKIRSEHKVITEQVLCAYNELVVAKQRIELLQTQKDLLKKENDG